MSAILFGYLNLEFREHDNIKKVAVGIDNDRKFSGVVGFLIDIRWLTQDCKRCIRSQKMGNLTQLTVERLFSNLEYPMIKPINNTADKNVGFT